MKKLVVVLLLIASIGIGTAYGFPHKQGMGQNILYNTAVNKSCNYTNSYKNNYTNYVNCTHEEKRIEKRVENRVENRTMYNRTNTTETVTTETLNNTLKVRERVKNIQKLRIKVEERIRRAGGIRAVERKFVSAKEQYMKLKEECIRLKMEGKLDLRHEKMFCLAAGNLVINWFDKIESAILNSNLNESIKDQLITQLEQEKMSFESKLKNVNTTENQEQFRQVVREIKEEWIKAKKVIEKVALEVAIVKLERTVNVAEKLEVKLTTLAPNSSLIQDYTNKVQEAKNLVENAKLNLNSGNLIEARKSIRMAVMNLKKAFLDAKLIVREINMQGRELINTTKMASNKLDILNVAGKGTFEFTGSGLVVVVAKNATISYTGQLLNNTGFVVANESLSGSGKATIKGENITVKVNGEWIRMFIRGTGKVYLNGNGTYWGNTMQHETLNGSVELTLGGGNQ